MPTIYLLNTGTTKTYELQACEYLMRQDSP